MAAELAVGGSNYYFVKYKYQTIGILRFIIDSGCPDFKDPSTTKLHRIYLNPKFHGLGLGRMLMEFVKSTAIKEKQDCIWLECMDTQQAAYDFYKKLDYTLKNRFVLDSPTMRVEYRGMFLMVCQIDKT